MQLLGWLALGGCMLAAYAAVAALRRRAAYRRLVLAVHTQHPIAVVQPPTVGELDIPPAPQWPGSSR
ncbi:hypothetical protein ACGFIY_21365 [Micromonospora chersina]|uniref:hypothetical protein n=1 Tax=Micromonospora chersina TaxID=47854 RepID=UPI00371DFC1E